MADADRQKWLRELAGRLKIARKRASLTLEEVGAHLGLSKQQASHWERARAEIRTWEIKRFAEITGADVAWLLTGRSTPAAPLVELRTIASLAAAEAEGGLVHNTEAWLEAAMFARVPKITIRTPGSIFGMAFEMPDRALEPEIALGDVIVADASVKPEPADVGLFVLVATGETLVRRLETPMGRFPFRLAATNPLFEPKQIIREHRPWAVKIIEVSRTYVAQSTGALAGKLSAN